ncbi:DNA-nicking endonuclease, Smr domain [Nitrosospira sp. Nl5]|uniref:Smr/MutS family protein n=1 Tax=Nitrosospira sp. Nl5 TaxID=200120 RepID=UPI0008902492|nr:Smr/MutS family protein [Nitrosospira sp. Nl5]SCY59076.1 DNA-nicking endonuclease, Smr domain [Nitrosospira sp. Nl5]
MKQRDKKSATGSGTNDAATPEIGDDDTALFLDAVRGVAPLPASDKIPHTRKQPLPIPRQVPPDQQTAPGDSLSDHVPLEMEAGDEWSFLRPGVSRQTLRRLRRGYWGIQAQLDLHGLTRDEARMELVAFLNTSHTRGLRCVRVIHGKGLSSKSHEPVLKARIGSWLSQRDDVLAFCQARPKDGGSGAVLVLLKISAPATAT